MPLSTVLGAQSLVQPAVCTTATRPASPYTGQAIYDTTTATQLIWNGTAWVATGGGLVCVKAETTFTTSSSVTADSVFTSAYTNYKIVMNYTTSAASGVLLRFRVGGVSASAATYNAFYAASTGWSAGTVLASTSFIVGDYSNGAFNCNQITEIQQPAIATATTIWNNATTSRAGYGFPYPQYTLGNHSTATAYDGVEYFVASGTMTGSYTIYGYAKTV